MALKSLERRLLLPIHAKKRSTTQRRAWTAKPICPLGLRTISTWHRGGGGGAFPDVAAVHEGELHEGPVAARHAHQRRRTNAVLDAGRMGAERQIAPVSVHHGMALTAFDFLARVVTARAAALGGLGALAVDHRRPRAGFAAPALTVEHHEVMVDRLEHAAVARQGEQR